MLGLRAARAALGARNVRSLLVGRERVQGLDGEAPRQRVSLPPARASPHFDGRAFSFDGSKGGTDDVEEIANRALFRGEPRTINDFIRDRGGAWRHEGLQNGNVLKPEFAPGNRPAHADDDDRPTSA